MRHLPSLGPVILPVWEEKNSQTLERTARGAGSSRESQFY